MARAHPDRPTSECDLEGSWGARFAACSSASNTASRSLMEWTWGGALIRGRPNTQAREVYPEPRSTAARSYPTCKAVGELTDLRASQTSGLPAGVCFKTGGGGGTKKKPGSCLEATMPGLQRIAKWLQIVTVCVR